MYFFPSKISTPANVKNQIFQNKILRFFPVTYVLHTHPGFKFIVVMKFSACYLCVPFPLQEKCVYHDETLNNKRMTSL